MSYSIEVCPVLFFQPFPSFPILPSYHYFSAMRRWINELGKRTKGHLRYEKFNFLSLSPCVRQSIKGAEKLTRPRSLSASGRKSIDPDALSKVIDGRSVLGASSRMGLTPSPEFTMISRIYINYRPVSKCPHLSHQFP